MLNWSFSVRWKDLRVFSYLWILSQHHLGKRLSSHNICFWDFYQNVFGFSCVGLIVFSPSSSHTLSFHPSPFSVSSSVCLSVPPFPLSVSLFVCLSLCLSLSLMCICVVPVSCHFYSAVTYLAIKRFGPPTLLFVRWVFSIFWYHYKCLSLVI